MFWWVTKHKTGNRDSSSHQKKLTHVAKLRRDVLLVTPRSAGSPPQTLTVSHAEARHDKRTYSHMNPAILGEQPQHHLAPATITVDRTALTAYWASDMTNNYKLQRGLFSPLFDSPGSWGHRTWTDERRTTDDNFTIPRSRILWPKNSLLSISRKRKKGCEKDCARKQGEMSNKSTSRNPVKQGRTREIENEIFSKS